MNESCLKEEHPRNTEYKGLGSLERPRNSKIWGECCLNETGKEEKARVEVGEEMSREQNIWDFKGVLGIELSLKTSLESF